MKPRNFMLVTEASFSDPQLLFPLIETHYVDAETLQHVSWGGWRARLVAWIIKKLLPRPTVWDVCRSKG